MVALNFVQLDEIDDEINNMCFSSKAAAKAAALGSGHARLGDYQSNADKYKVPDCVHSCAVRVKLEFPTASAQQTRLHRNHPDPSWAPSGWAYFSEGQ